MGRGGVVKKANALHPTVSLDALAAKMREPGFSLPDLLNLFTDRGFAFFAAKRSSKFRHIRYRPGAEVRRARRRPRTFQSTSDVSSFVRAPPLAPEQEHPCLGLQAVLVPR